MAWWSAPPKSCPTLSGSAVPFCHIALGVVPSGKVREIVKMLKAIHTQETATVAGKVPGVLADAQSARNVVGAANAHQFESGVVGIQT